MNRKTLIVSSLIILTGLIIGLTYAYFTWNTRPEEETTVRVVVDGLSITYNGGDEIIDASLNPTLTKEEGIVKEVTMTLANSRNTSVCADFNLILTTLPTELQHESFKYELYKNDVIIGEGNFAGKTEGQTIKIGTSQTVTDVLDTYTLYLWIDGNMNNPLEMGGKSFSFTLNANAAEGSECNPSVITYIPWVVADTSIYGNSEGANAPELFEGLIPIRYESDESNEWYNYTDKKWANAVMVTEGTRETYMNASPGTKIKEEDVLAYWVWIPRYSYKLWNVGPNFEVATYDGEGNCSGNCPFEIQIEFESVTTPKSINNEVDKWLTHPAFTFGETELEGFWVAKFESSSDVSCIAGTNDTLGTGCNKTEYNPRILPGVTSWRGTQVSTQYLASQKFMNVEYLTETGVAEVDSHMMKNTEWGAVAYLSHSKYGINEEIYLNNTSQRITGRSGGAVSGVASAAYGSYTYDGRVVGTDGSIGEFASDVTLGTKASSTGNIYGVYDMNGGSYEYVMGNYNKNSGNSETYNSGFNGNVYSGNPITTGIVFPEDKYVNIYTGTNITNSILGDATGETAGWYQDGTSFVISDYPWFIRGGDHNYGAVTGAFLFSRAAGGTYTSSTFRISLTAK